jgi:hypothetical protein
VATIAVVLAATGCGGEPDPFRIRFRLSQGPAYSCPASSCDGVAMTCDAVAVIRIVDPADPGRAFVSECIEIDNPEDVCDLGRADLPAGLMVPDQELEVQIALFPRAALIGASGEVECPSVLDFGLADGFPVNVAPAPALGGRTYVHAEDGEAVVELGCGAARRRGLPRRSSSRGVGLGRRLRQRRVRGAGGGRPAHGPRRRADRAHQPDDRADRVDARPWLDRGAAAA